MNTFLRNVRLLTYNIKMYLDHCGTVSFITLSLEVSFATSECA